MKVAKACGQCRARKGKCIVAGGDEPRACAPCARRGVLCSFIIARGTAPRPRLLAAADSTSQSSSSVTSNPGVSTAAIDLDLGLESRLELVRLYLRLIHDKPHTLFHPASLLQQVRDDAVPDQLLLGIVAMAAPFSPCPDVRSQVARLVDAAKVAFKADMEAMSLANVHAAILLGNLCGAHGHPDAEMLYFGIAFRIAQIIRLPAPAASDGPIECEVKLRTWWSLYMIDRWSSAGTDIHRQLPDDSIYPLPMEELQFYALSRTGPGHATSECPLSRRPPAADPVSYSRPGLWGRMVQLAEIFGAVGDLHKRYVEGIVDNDQLEDTTQQLSVLLDAWATGLPPNLTPTPDNVARHARDDLGSAFVALHLGYHHYATLLYFPYLDLQLERTERQVLFSSRCRDHAAAFSDLLLLSDATQGCGAVHLVVAHMTTVSSAALLHVLLFGSEAELPQTRARLEVNFKRLVRLRRYWPAVDLMMERLFTFQRACISSVDPNTHKIDRWMAKFLLQHALPIADKIPPVREGAGPSSLMERDIFASDALSMLRP
ncbi:hypothetical protein RB595_003625 [Gaeumannomyces hyphopodioides]